MEASTVRTRLIGVTRRHLQHPLRLLARGVSLAGTIVSALLAIGILFVVLGGNPHNDIVSTIQDSARTLSGPFDDMFTPHSHKLAVAINWGVAIVVYLIAASTLAGLIRRLAKAED
jgi:hypothetical protein